MVSALQTGVQTQKKPPISPRNVKEIFCGVNETLKLMNGVYRKITSKKEKLVMTFVPMKMMNSIGFRPRRTVIKVEIDEM